MKHLHPRSTLYCLVTLEDIYSIFKFVYFNLNTVHRMFFLGWVLSTMSRFANKSFLKLIVFIDLIIGYIIKHCKDFAPALVTGQLLGLDVGSVLEVTNCFPFPEYCRVCVLTI